MACTLPQIQGVVRSPYYWASLGSQHLRHAQEPRGCVVRTHTQENILNEKKEFEFEHVRQTSHTYMLAAFENLQPDRESPQFKRKLDRNITMPEDS